MGAWGFDAFENDAAMDWLGETNGDLEAIADAFREVSNQGEDDYLEVDIGSVAVAACEALVKYHAPRKRFLRKPTSPPTESDLISSALTVLDRVTGSQSELAELWNEGGPNEEWAECIQSLRSRLLAL